MVARGDRNGCKKRLEWLPGIFSEDQGSKNVGGDKILATSEIFFLHWTSIFWLLLVQKMGQIYFEKCRFFNVKHHGDEQR